MTHPMAMALPILATAALCSARADTPPVVGEALIGAAMERTTRAVRYDGSYRRLAYPMGDVDDDVGVCTDLIIRAYRKVGIDLQQLVHEDMTAAFGEYPPRWGLKRPDANIDHRRVPNLQAFFRRHGRVLPKGRNPNRYFPGELVT